MKVIDISRELLSAPVYPGDRAPVVTHVFDTLLSIEFSVGVKKRMANYAKLEKL